MVATNVIMPSLGFDMKEGRLVRWLKNTGERVEKGQAIAEIETEKATVEIEATVAGVLEKVLVPADQTVPVGTVIAVIAEPGEKMPSVSSPATSLPTPAPETAKPIQPTPQQPEVVRKTEPDSQRIKASPLARRLANEAGLDLANVQGTGPGGRIMERDIEAALAKTNGEHEPAVAAKTAPGQAQQVTKPERQPTAPNGGEPLSRMRQAIARRMAESKATVPHFYVTIEVNMTEAMRVREQLNALASDDAKVSVNDLIVAAASRTLRQFPDLNSSYRDGTLERHPQVNIGIAVAVDGGLLTPVIKDADKKSLKQLAAEAQALGERARTNKLRAEDLGGATFTVSNLGMFGVDEFAAIINPPEAGILAVGSAIKRAIVGDDDELLVAPMLRATLSVDHRVADGAQAARYLQAMKRVLENPVNLLLTA